MASPDLHHGLLPSPLYPGSVGKAGWPLEGLSPCLLEDLACPAAGKHGLPHLTAQWIQNVDVVTATSAQGQIGSGFPFRGEGCSCLLLETYLYILLMCVFPFLQFLGFPPKIACSLGSSGSVVVLCLSWVWPCAGGIVTLSDWWRGSP